MGIHEKELEKKINLFTNEVSSLETKSEEYRNGFTNALDLIIAIGYHGFGGDACDFAEFLKEIKER